MTKQQPARKNVGKLITGKGAINFYCPHFGLAFLCQVVSLTDDSLITTLPEFVMYRERRNESRCRLEGEIKIILKVGKKEIYKTVHDLSNSGISVIFSKSVTPRW